MIQDSSPSCALTPLDRVASLLLASRLARSALAKAAGTVPPPDELAGALTTSARTAALAILLGGVGPAW